MRKCPECGGEFKKKIITYDERWGDTLYTLDRMSAELACIYFVKLTRTINSDNTEAIYKMDLLVKNQLKDLKATKFTGDSWAGQENKK